jgi:hypothetical protein
MFTHKKWEGGNQEILEVDENLKTEDFQYILQLIRQSCNRINTSKDYILVSLTAFQEKIFTNYMA